MSEEVKEEVVKNETSEETTATEETEVETTEVETEEDEGSNKKSDLHLRVEELTQDNQRQKTLLDQLMLVGLGNQSGNQQQVLVDENSDEPVTGKQLKRLQQQQNQQFQGIMSGVLEEMDRTAMLASPKSTLYAKYQREVEQYRNQMGQQGRFFKREEALANVLLNKGLLGETSKTTPKKVVKQKVVPGGEVNSAGVPTKKVEQKPATARERLAGVKF